MINGAGRTVVATSGVAVTVTPTSLPCSRLDIQAMATNTKKVVIGGQGVIADEATRIGIALDPGQVYNLELVTDALLVWLDAEVNGEGITWSYYRGDRV